MKKSPSNLVAAGFLFGLMLWLDGSPGAGVLIFIACVLLAAGRNLVDASRRARDIQAYAEAIRETNTPASENEFVGPPNPRLDTHA